LAKSSNNTLVTIIIPVGREGAGLSDRLRNYISSLAQATPCRGYRFEVILVTDVHDDETLQELRRLTSDGGVKAYMLTKRLGKGGSIKNVLRYARGDTIVLLDADTPINPNTLCRVLRLREAAKADLIVANRLYRSHTLLRRLLSTGYNILVNILFHTGMRDHQAGFKVFTRRAAAILLLGRTRTDGLAYDTELIIWARHLGLRLRVVNVAWLEARKESTIPPLRSMLTMLADLLMLRLITIAGKLASLHRVPVGRVVDLSTGRTVGVEFMTIIEASGVKAHIFNLLRRLYVGLLRKG